MANKLPFVRIQSNKDINVTCGLQNQDVTNKDAHVPDRLKVNPLWPKATVLIRAGAGIYPSEITEWPTVKALSADKVITIGEYLASAETDEQKDVKNKLNSGITEIKQAQEEAKKAQEAVKQDVKQSLADIAK